MTYMKFFLLKCRTDRFALRHGRLVPNVIQGSDHFGFFPTNLRRYLTEGCMTFINDFPSKQCFSTISNCLFVDEKKTMNCQGYDLELLIPSNKKQYLFPSHLMLLCKQCARCLSRITSIYLIKFASGILTILQQRYRRWVFVMFKTFIESKLIVFIGFNLNFLLFKKFIEKLQAASYSFSRSRVAHVSLIKLKLIHFVLVKYITISVYEQFYIFFNTIQ